MFSKVSITLNFEFEEPNGWFKSIPIVVIMFPLSSTLGKVITSWITSLYNGFKIIAVWFEMLLLAGVYIFIFVFISKYLIFVAAVI